VGRTKIPNHWQLYVPGKFLRKVLVPRNKIDWCAQEMGSHRTLLGINSLDVHKMATREEVYRVNFRVQLDSSTFTSMTASTWVCAWPWQNIMGFSHCYNATTCYVKQTNSTIRVMRATEVWEATMGVTPFRRSSWRNVGFILVKDCTSRRGAYIVAVEGDRTCITLAALVASLS